MKLLRSIGVAASAALFASAPAMAQDTMRDKPNPWLDCGLGAMIFPDANLEVGAGISNIIWDLGTTAVTSAQSSPDTCNGLDNVRTAMFIERTFDTLEVEIAKGEGNNLDTLAGLVGAEGDAFAASLRAEYAALLAGEAATPETLYAAVMAIAS